MGGMPSIVVPMRRVIRVVCPAGSSHGRVWLCLAFSFCAGRVGLGRRRAWGGRIRRGEGRQWRRVARRRQASRIGIEKCVGGGGGEGRAGERVLGLGRQALRRRGEAALCSVSV
jgi:hypothetical protein